MSDREIELFLANNCVCPCGICGASIDICGNSAFVVLDAEGPGDTQWTFCEACSAAIAAEHRRMRRYV